jgi:hypothetical protein
MDWQSQIPESTPSKKQFTGFFAARSISHSLHWNLFECLELPGGELGEPAASTTSLDRRIQ